MNTVTLVHPDRLDPSILPENGPVGSIVPFTAFATPKTGDNGEPGFLMRDGFGGMQPNPLLAMLGVAPARTLDQDVALDRAKIDPRKIIFEIVQGEMNFKPTDDDPRYKNQQRTTAADLGYIDGYWVAYPAIQEGDPGLVSDLLFQRVL